jgi:hypothetical protein
VTIDARGAEWTGEESLAGKTILLRDSGSIGDTFQGCRYATPLGADRGATVILSARPALLDLLRTVPGPHRVIDNTSPHPVVDYWIDLMHLPRMFERSAATIYAPRAYLRASDSLTAAWRQRLGHSGRPRVGLAWWTSTTWPTVYTDCTGKPVREVEGSGLRRSIPLGDLIEQLPSDLEYVSLQHQVRDSDEEALRSSSIAHFGEEMTFDHAASVMGCCNLIIANDSSLAHLAGALGRPVWIVLPSPPDWRWFLGRSDSPWYPTAWLFRQHAEGEWKGVLEEIGGALLAGCRTKRSVND